MEWYNLELGNHYSMDAIETIAKCQYVFNSLAKVECEVYFVYDSSVTYYEDAYGTKCNVMSSVNLVTVDIEFDTIEIYRMDKDDLELVKTITMS